MPVTTLDEAPDTGEEQVRVRPWDPDWHRPGTKRHRGWCDMPRCGRRAVNNVQFWRDGTIARVAARCTHHSPADGPAPATPRPDPQRGLVYRAEEQCWFTLARDGHPAAAPVDRAAVQRLVDGVAATLWWSDVVASPGAITVVAAARNRPGHASPGTIALPSPATTWVAVHELAHHAAGFDGQPHGPLFAGRLLDLHSLVHGVPVARMLLDAFDTAGVHHRAPTLW